MLPSDNKHMAQIILPIDPFQITQGFGENPASYARFGLKGHNGWDIRTIYPDTPNGKRKIMAPQDSKFYRVGNEGNDGFGKYIEIITKTSKNTWKHTFAHCDSYEAFTDKKMGESIATSDNTGNSTAPHSHWTAKRLNADGSVKDYDNGYFGAVNPQEYIDEVRADIINLPTTMPTELQKYRIDWKEIAVSKGLDVNSSQFADYRNIDKIISDKISAATDSKNKEIQSLKDQLALAGQSNKYTDVGHAFIDLVKKTQGL